MSDQSLFLGLPYIQAAQAQKHVTHNEALRRLDWIAQLSVVSDEQTAPPATPEDGARYIVAPDASGDWAGQDGRVAIFEGTGVWRFEDPQPGWRAWVDAAGTISVCAVGSGLNGVQWTRLFTALNDLEQFGLGATATPTTPFVVRAPQALWDHVPTSMGGTGSVIQSINRETQNHDAGIAFQTGYTTQALLGYFGGAEWRLSTSSDGVQFSDALRIDPTTGIAQQPQRPRFKGHTNFDNPLNANTWTKVAINDLSLNPTGAFDAATNLFTAPASGSYLLGGTVVFAIDKGEWSRLGMRFVRNGSANVQGGSITQNSGSQTDRISGVSHQVLVHLEAGDQVEMQAIALRSNCFAAAQDTAFWGIFMP